MPHLPTKTSVLRREKEEEKQTTEKGADLLLSLAEKASGRVCNEEDDARSPVTPSPTGRVITNPAESTAGGTTSGQSATDNKNDQQGDAEPNSSAPARGDSAEAMSPANSSVSDEEEPVSASKQKRQISENSLEETERKRVRSEAGEAEDEGATDANNSQQPVISPSSSNEGSAGEEPSTEQNNGAASAMGVTAHNLPPHGYPPHMMAPGYHPSAYHGMHQPVYAPPPYGFAHYPPPYYHGMMHPSRPGVFPSYPANSGAQSSPEKQGSPSPSNAVSAPEADPEGIASTNRCVPIKRPLPTRNWG